MQQSYHKVKVCPVPGCRAKPQRYLSIHLRRYHTHLTDSQQAKITSMATIVRSTPKSTNLAMGMPTVTSLFKREATEQQREPEVLPAVPSPKSSTRSFPKFPLDHADIKPFVEWLTTPDGRNKSTAEARAIATYDRDTHYLSMSTHPCLLSDILVRARGFVVT